MMVSRHLKRPLDFLRAHEALLFAVFSLAGWFIDFLLFSLLVYAAGFSPFAANYASSVAGAGFAFSAFCFYSASHGYAPRLAQIASYVVYQLVSITFYSWLVQVLANSEVLRHLEHIAPLAAAALIAKIAVTPLNFVTNYISTRTLLRFLRPRGINPRGHGVD